jgi:hypothetical protein
VASKCYKADEPAQQEVKKESASVDQMAGTNCPHHFNKTNEQDNLSQQIFNLLDTYLKFNHKM